MVRPLAYTLIVGILSLVMAWHGAAVAQPDAIERIDALHSLSEKDNAQALQRLVVLGQKLGAYALYTTRREYLSTLIDI